MIRVKPARSDDAPTLLEMREALWPECSEAEHREEIARLFAGRLYRDPFAVLIAENDEGRILGFAELSIRPYAEGCRTNRVSYLEGWYVRPEARKQGIGKALVEASESWGRDQGCTEFASDADPENDISFAAHRSVGFQDMGLVRCFKKRI